MTARIRSRVQARTASSPFWTGEVSLTYGELDQALGGMSALVGQQGWDVGDRVGLACGRAADTTLAFLGLVDMGVTAVILDPAAPPDRLGPILAASRLSGLIADPDVADALQAAGVLPDGVKVVRVTGAPKAAGFFGRLKQSFRASPLPDLAAQVTPLGNGAARDVAADTPAYILFTSGSTSAPKGVVIAHSAFCAQIDEFSEQWNLTDDSRILNLLPMHHTDGINMGPVLALWNGASVVRPFAFRVDRLPELMDLVYKHRVTHFIGVPSLMALILDLLSDRRDAFQTGDFRHFISTAAYLDPTLWQTFQDTFGIRVNNCYGLTETVSQILYCGPDDASHQVGTVGRPRHGRARVCDDQDQPLGTGQTGELHVTGANLMTGYFDNAEATTAALTPDGWLRTGDLATIDEGGVVRIVGRKKSVIITGGINIYPEEIDEEARRLPGVRDAATVGVEDRTWGERAITVVVPAAGAELDIQSVNQALAGVLAPEKRPHKILVIEALPRTPSGKVAGPQLKAWVSEQLAPVAAAPTGALTEQGFLELAARCFHEDVATLNLRSVQDDVGGWTSLSLLELLVELEGATGHQFQPKEVLSIRTLGDLYRVCSG